MNGPNAVTSAPLLALSVFGQQECGCSTRRSWVSPFFLPTLAFFGQLFIYTIIQPYPVGHWLTAAALLDSRTAAKKAYRP